MSDASDFPSFHPEPLLIVISGPSGVGKDTVIQRIKTRGGSFQFVVTANTRPPRPDERDGVDYIFVTEDQFAGMVKRGELLEHALVYNEHKGIPRAHVRAALASGKDVILRVDVQGAATIRQRAPEALLIFLTTQDEDELVRRLTARKTESNEDRNLRIAMARQEMQRVDIFDYVVVNREDQIDQTVDIILAIICAEHHRVHHRKVSL